MPWRLHLTNQAILRLNIIASTPPVLAIWLDRQRVFFYDLETGTSAGEGTHTPPETNERQSDTWQVFAASLTAPDGTYLPILQTKKLTTYATDDGRMRLYHTGHADLFLNTDGKEFALDSAAASNFMAVALDRLLGIIVALDTNGKLYVYQQHILVGAFDLGLSLRPDLYPGVAISRGGGALFVTDGQIIILTDSGGKIHKKIDTHYFVRLMSCSPDGRYLITCDMDAGVLRVYDGKDLTLSHQRFAIDLVAEAPQIQLLADLPPDTVALSALTINNDGLIAFSMTGVVCVTNMAHMDKLPRPQALL